MVKRDVVHAVINHKKPPYVPWSFAFTQEAQAKLEAHFPNRDLEDVLQNHLINLGNGIGFFEPVGNERYKDVFGAVWNREVDKDIGVVETYPLSGPTLRGYTFPDPEAELFFEDIPEKLAKYPDRYRVFNIGFSLFERAWTMRS